MPGPGFVHLRGRSAYSLLEGALPVGKLVGLAQADAHPAVAVADANSLFGAVEFSDKAASSGLQPIVGLTLSVDFADREASRDPRAARKPQFVLLARSEAGYRNLMALSS